MKTVNNAITGLALLLPLALAGADDRVLEEVVVTAEFRPMDRLDLAGSVTVLGNDAIERRGATHLEQLLALAPNVNLSSGASRGRFIQVRGAGERSQFVEPVNPSVGLVIDGMDFTGIGGAAMALDLEQVEILRGPQGTLFGANALAGLVHMVSRAPDDARDGEAGLVIGNRGTVTAHAALGAPLGEQAGFRLAAQAHRSDGFMDNRFLDQRTNDLDERTARARLRWHATDVLTLDVVAYLLDIDNGYDAFSLDNSRDTFSDEPGHDRLDAAAGSVRAIWSLSDTLAVEALLSGVDADTDYAYDEDWSHPGICEGTPCDFDLWGFDWWYASTDRYRRNNRNATADLRVLGESTGGSHWVAGLYGRDQSQSLLREYTFAAGDYGSDFDSDSLAIYGQVDLPLGPRWTLQAGLRWENRNWDFDDNTPEDTAASGGDDAWGGRLALEYRWDSGVLAYALVSRGYKAGGVNTQLLSQRPDLEAIGIELPADAFIFSPESLLNVELGVKARLLDDRLGLSLALFHQDRDDMQVKQSLVIPAEPGTAACPCVFVDSFQNASGGINQGLEVELQWQVTDQLRLFGSLGLLDTEYTDYLSFSHAQADPANGIPYNLSGRAQAHAPDHQFALGGLWQWDSGWYAQVDVEGRDGFYASANHDERIDAHALLNLRAGLERDRWSLSAWVRNLSDETVQTRGFGGFGNDPRKLYITEPYYQLGEPRVYGVTGLIRF